MAPDDSAAPAEPTASAVFGAWERLRIWFHVAVALCIVPFALPHLAKPWFWVVLAKGTLIANVAFCAGPVAEGYLVMLGLTRKGARRMVFAAGTFLTVVAAIGAIGTAMLRHELQ